VDGRDGIGVVLQDEYEYLRVARTITDFPAALSHFISRIPYDNLPDTIPNANWPVHIAGHPPGALGFFVLLSRTGLGDGFAAGVVVTLIAATTALAVMVTLRLLGAEQMARWAAPFLVFGPAAIWQAVSADAMFAAVAAWGIAALAASAVATRNWRLAGWGVLAGLLLGYSVMLSYGLPLMGLLAIAVLVVARSWWPLPWAVVAALAVVLTFAAYGFSWWEALPALRERYWAGVASNRPPAYWNWGNLAALFLDRSFDPGNRYTVPYQWGVTGYAYRTDRISPAPDSWDVLWDTRYAGKMTQLDDGREVLTPFLLMRGYSLNSVNPSQLEEAKIDAIRAKKNIKAYIAAPVKGQLISGDVWLAQLWNGDATQAKLEQPSIGYLIPREGCSIWEDSLVIPRHASHKRAAHEFVNYILRADVGAAISDTTGYGSPNVAAVARMEHPVPFPTDEEMKRLEFQKDLGKATALVDQIYTEIKAE